MKFKALLVLLSSFSFSICTVAQTIPALPKEWKGTITATAIGANQKMSPNHHENIGKDKSAKGWNTYSESRTLKIVRQEGRHLEILFKSSRGEQIWAGTLSKDGKQVMLASKNASYLFSISADTLSGCGTSRGMDGSFDHWLTNYSAICYEFSAVK
ncbi:hypothetical protein MCEZE4_00230 [Burkholderiaceae bacterium]|jgi:hypothetical protein